MITYPLYSAPEMDLPTAVTCGRLLDHSYGAIRQWQAMSIQNRDKFVWKKPNPTVADLDYSDPFFGEFHKIVTRRKGQKTIRVSKLVSSPLGFVASDDRRVFVVIRGTSLSPEWMKINAKFPQKPLLVEGVDYGEVHQGFKSYFDTIEEEMYGFVDAVVNTNKALILTGHSLGGGVAAIALPHLYERYKNKTQSLTSYSFACPRVGNLDYSRQLEAKDVLAHRIVNTEDLVPDVPPATVLKGKFRHYGSTTTFTANYETVANTHNTPALIYALEHPNAPETSRAEFIAWAKEQGLVQKPS